MSSLLTLADLKTHVNITSSVHDLELQAFADSVDALVESQIGVVINRSVSEVVDLTGYAIEVHSVPIVSITSLVLLADGTSAYDVSQLYVRNAVAGLIKRKDGGCIATGSGSPYTITYTAGRGASVPSTINLAARIIAAHLWETQRGPASRPTLGGDELSTPAGLGFAVPNRAAELLRAYALPPNLR